MKKFLSILLSVAMLVTILPASIGFAQEVSVLKDGEVWADFDADTLSYDVKLERTQLSIPQFDFNAAEGVQITEPEKYVLGENKVVVTPADGEAIEYTINISYKMAEFNNFTSPMLQKSEIFAIPNVNVSLDNYKDPVMKGISPYMGYPSLNSNGSINLPASVKPYLGALGYAEGRLFVFRSSKGPNNASAWYKGGVGKYDGTDDNYFLTFDIEAEGTMYIYLREEAECANKIAPNVINANLIKEGYKLHSKAANTYYKKYYPGETVKVPAMGWNDSLENLTGTSLRLFMNSAYFMFGYDKDPSGVPEAFDTADTTLKKFEYIADGETKTVDGFEAGVSGGEYLVKVPAGTKKIVLKAESNEPYSEIAYSSKVLELTDGVAEATVTVTAVDGSSAEYKVTFEENVIDPSDATLREVEYKIGENSAVEIDVNSAVENRFYAFLPIGTVAENVKVTATATSGNDVATVEIEDITAWENYKATATITVTSANGEVTNTYYVDFEVEKPYSEQENKIYNLTAPANKYKTDNFGYQTEDEAANTPNMIVIGENLTSTALPFYDRNTYKFKGISEDMIGATYIRVGRNHAQYDDVKASGPVTRTVEGGETQTANTFNGYTGTYGFRKINSLTKAWYNGAFSAADGEPGWISFNVSSDCTVVVADIAGYGWPNLDKDLWRVSKSTIYGNAKTYYRSFNAGDLVQIPNYGIGGKLEDDTKVVYSYLDDKGVEATYETTVGKDIIIWEEIAVAVKWEKTLCSDNSLKSVKVDGKEADLSKMADKKLTVYTYQTEGSLSLEVEAKDAAAEVNAPEAVEVGKTTSFTVTAEDGTVATYSVDVIVKDIKNTNLTSLSYKTNDGEWVKVDGFAADKLVYDVPALVYAKDGIEIEIAGTPENEDASTSGVLSGKLVYGSPLTLIFTVIAADGETTKDYELTFTMAEKVFSAVLEGTPEYKALFKEGKYTDSYVPALDSPATYSEKQVSMATWDDDGFAKCRTYLITVDGEAFTEGANDSKNPGAFKYEQAIAVKKAKEAEGKTVVLTAKGWDYTYSQVTTMVGSVFNAGAFHTTGVMGKAFSEANFQILTNREIAAGRITSGQASIYNNWSDAKTFVLSQENYAMQITPNSKATVYMAFSNSKASSHKGFKADGWTFMDFSSAMSDELASLPESAFADVYKNQATKTWFMVKADTVLQKAPYTVVKIQPDTGSSTLGITFPYVWYKTVDEDETLMIPTPGVDDQHAYKGFVIEGEHVEPMSSDATLSSLSVAGKAINLESNKFDYTAELPYGTTSVAVEAVANDKKASVEGSGEVAVKNGDVITVKVTAEDGTEQEYRIAVSIDEEPAISLDVTLKSLSYNIDDILSYDIGIEYGALEYTVDVPSNAEKVEVFAEAENEAALVSVTGGLEEGRATVTVTAGENNTCTYTVNFNVLKIPFVNIVSNDTFIKTENVFKVIDADVENVRAEVFESSDPVAVEVKLNGFKAAINAINAKYGENAARGTSIWASYPAASRTATGAKLDNPMEFGDGYEADFVIDGDSWVFKSTKGGTPTEDDALSFGKNDEYLTFDVTKPGTMYVVDANGWGYKGGLDNGFKLLQGYRLAKGTAYAKHFEAGKVTVPAQDTDKYVNGTRQPNTIGFVFVFDDETSTAIKSLSYNVGNNINGKIAYFGRESAKEYEIESLPYDGKVEVEVEVVEKGATYDVAGELVGGNGDIVITVTAADGVTTDTYTLKFVCKPDKIVACQKAAGAPWIESIYADAANSNLGNKWVVDDKPIQIGTTYTYTDRTNKLTASENLNGATYIRVPKNEAPPSKTIDIRAYGPGGSTENASFTVQVGDNEPVVYTKSVNAAKFDDANAIGFRAFEGVSKEKDFFKGAYDGKNGNPYWVTFVPTSDCTVIIGDNVQLVNVGGHNSNQGYPNLDKSLWKNNTSYSLNIGADRTYVRHFKAGEVVQIPNYGIGELMSDNTPVVYTYIDANGETQTYETTVSNNTVAWDNITIAVVWDDCATDVALNKLYINGEFVDGLDASATEYVYELAAGETAKVSASVLEPATVVITDSEGNEKDEFAIGEIANITVTAGNGNVKTYTVEFKQEPLYGKFKADGIKVLGDKTTEITGANADITAGFEKLSAEGKLVNNGKSDIETLVTIVLYNALGAIEEKTSIEVPVAEGAEVSLADYAIEIPAAKVADGYTVKCFVWEKNNIAPLCDAVEVEFDAEK